MKIWTTILTGVLLVSCNSRPAKINTISNDTLKSNRSKQDSTMTLAFRLNIKDSSIINTTGRTVDVLCNSVDGFLDGHRNSELNFQTECMVCQPFQSYESGLVFGKRLYFDKDLVKIYLTDINISDTANVVKTYGFYGDTKKKAFNFSQVKVRMKYQGQSCSDADYVKVDLKYEDGSIEINKLINASFFEYDLNNDGEMEQYLFGIRNCSQEFVVLRISKPVVSNKL